MTRTLKQYLGQKCMVTGHLDRFNPIDDRTNILLQGCKIEGFEGWELFEDHLWQAFDAEEFAYCKQRFSWRRLDHVSYAGVVVEYQRKDHSIDYAVKFDRSLLRWSKLIKAKYLDPEVTIELIDRGGIFNDYIGLDRDRFLVQLAALRHRLQATIDRPEPTIRAFEFAPPPAKKNACKGFSKRSANRQ